MAQFWDLFLKKVRQMLGNFRVSNQPLRWREIGKSSRTYNLEYLNLF
jgi:hypothetical protein